MRFCLLLSLVWIGGWSYGQSNSVGTDIGLTFKASYFSRYLFRGHTYSQEDTYQGEVGLGIASWSYNLLYTDPGANNTTIGEEYNHTVSFTTVSGRSITTTGYQLFDYDGDGLDTQELFIRYSRATKWNPSYGIAYDIDRYKGYYVDFSLGRSLPFTRRSQFTFSGQAALAFELEPETDRTGTETEAGFFSKDGLVHASLHVHYLFQFTRRINLEIGYAFHRATDDSLYDDMEIDRDQSVAHATFKIVIP